jgi:hypothetical protein
LKKKPFKHFLIGSKARKENKLELVKLLLTHNRLKKKTKQINLFIISKTVKTLENIYHLKEIYNIIFLLLLKLYL